MSAILFRDDYHHNANITNVNIINMLYFEEIYFKSVFIASSRMEVKTTERV